MSLPAWPFWALAYAVGARAYARAGGHPAWWILSSALAAAAAHGAWLSVRAAPGPPPAPWDGPLGASVVGLPAGPLVVAACLPRAARARHAAALVPAALALLAVARLGCVAAGCCPVRGPLPRLGALLDAALWLGLRGRLPAGSAGAGWRLLLVFGLARALADPLRVERGSPPWSVPALSLGWAALGAAASLYSLAPLRARRRRRAGRKHR